MNCHHERGNSPPIESRQDGSRKIFVKPAATLSPLPQKFQKLAQFDA
jgi:hypothetical protein